MNPRKQAGFTLVEISIVLVIVGLLLGAVLKGQELIFNSKVKASFNLGRELTVAVLDSRETGRPTALPVIEIRPRRGQFFDYAEKYSADGAEELCPAPLEEPVARAAQALALKVHEILGLRGLSRTDMMLAEDGSLQVLETNTMPGMTARSLVPRAAGAIGLPFPALIEGLVRSASLA